MWRRKCNGHMDKCRFLDSVILCVYSALNAPSLYSRCRNSSVAQYPRICQLTKTRYLKCIDKFFNNYISCFVTGAGVKFLLLHQPIIPTSTNPSRTSTAIGANPTSPATEEAIKLFFTEVYENWVKAVMSPFYKANMEVTSPVFRARVSAAGRKYL